LYFSHCQICACEISEVAASSIRLQIGTPPRPRSQASMYCAANANVETKSVLNLCALIENQQIVARNLYVLARPAKLIWLRHAVTHFLRHRH